MATQAQSKKFIAMIAPITQNLCKSRKKWILPSVTIAQACCESAYGTSKSMVEANGLFGFKVGKGVRYGNAWKGKSYSTKTKEFYEAYVTITDNFRAYDSVAEAIEDYMDLLCSLKRYLGAVNQTEPRTCITAIKNGGYATSPTYINTILGIIKKYNLTIYDNVVIGQSTIKPTLRYGSRGIDVKFLQHILTSNGYNIGAIDGIFGTKTLDAVKMLQLKNGLSVDGIVGQKTWAVLTV